MDPVEMVMRNVVANLERDIPLLERSAQLARSNSWYATEEYLDNTIRDLKRAHGNLKTELVQSFGANQDGL